MELLDLRRKEILTNPGSPNEGSGFGDGPAVAFFSFYLKKKISSLLGEVLPVVLQRRKAAFLRDGFIYFGGFLVFFFTSCANWICSVNPHNK